MTPFLAFRRATQIVAACAIAGAMCARSAQAQQLIGYVKADDADVSGATDVLDGQAVLAGSAGVTAKSHTAVITLGRGGLARVCQTSALHMTQSKATSSVSDAAPLLFSLERGAVEIRMNGLANDAIMTPDLRMTVQTNGPLDVRLRVARNGDTCVENRGGAAPTLAVSDPFGTSRYELMAGQHVLFEHGDMHEVVDHEAEPCGCPDEKGASVADALLASGGQKLGKAPTPTEQHPFPAAISEGLAPAAERPAGEADPAQPQATTALVYNANADTSPNTNTAPSAAGGVNAAAGGRGAANAANAGAAARSAQTAPVAEMAAVPASAAPASLGAVQPVKQEPAQANADQSPKRDLLHAIGDFFRYLFRR